MYMVKKEVKVEKKELLKPKNDLIFQSLFNQNNERITKAFVEALLEEKVEHIRINNDKELVREYPEDKLGILDLQLDINYNEKVDVEVQLIEKENFVERLLYYFSKLYESQIRRGDEYTEAKRVVLIAILDYKLEKTKIIEEMETIWTLREKKRPELTLTNNIEIVIIELEKVRRAYEKDKNNKKAQWMLFLDDPNSKEVKEIMEKNENIKEAIVEVHKMSEDEKMRRLADLREKAILDEKAIYKAGEKRGIEQGRKEKKEMKREIITQMLKKNMSIEDIQEITGETKEQILKQKNEVE